MMIKMSIKKVTKSHRRNPTLETSFISDSLQIYDMYLK